VDVLTPYTPDAGRNLAVHDEESEEIPGRVAAIGCRCLDRHITL
jgi:hypothetical protein